MSKAELNRDLAAWDDRIRKAAGGSSRAILSELEGEGDDSDEGEEMAAEIQEWIDAIRATNGQIVDLGGAAVPTPRADILDGQATLTVDEYNQALRDLGDEEQAVDEALEVRKARKPTPTLTLTLPGGAITFDGSPHPATATLADANGPLAGTVEIVYVGAVLGRVTEPVHADSYRVVAGFAGDDDHEKVEVVAPARLVIAKAPLRLIAPTVDKPYGAPIPSLDGRAEGLKGGDQVSVAGRADAKADTPPDEKGHPITPEATFTKGRPEDYDIRAEAGLLTIKKATPKVEVVAPPPSPFDGSAHRASGRVVGALGADLGGLSFRYQGQATGETADPMHADTYKVVATFPGDDGHEPATDGATPLVIAKAKLRVTANDASKDYGAVVPPLTGQVKGLVGTDAATVACTTVATAGSDADITGYPIVPTLTFTSGRAEDYEIEPIDGRLAVRPAIPRIVLTVPSTAVVYDGKRHEAEAKVLGVGDAVVGQAVVAYQGNSGATDPTGADSYAVLATFAGDNKNYGPADAAKALLVIDPSPIRLSVPDASINQGDPLPNLAVKIEGAGAAAFTAVVGGLPADSGTPGISPLTPQVTGGPAGWEDNYTIAEVPGTLTIVALQTAKGTLKFQDPRFYVIDPTHGKLFVDLEAIRKESPRIDMEVTYKVDLTGRFPKAVATKGGAAPDVVSVQEQFAEDMATRKQALVDINYFPQGKIKIIGKTSTWDFTDPDNPTLKTMGSGGRKHYNDPAPPPIVTNDANLRNYIMANLGPSEVRTVDATSDVITIWYNRGQKLGVKATISYQDNTKNVVREVCVFHCGPGG